MNHRQLLCLSVKETEMIRRAAGLFTLYCYTCIIDTISIFRNLNVTVIVACNYKIIEIPISFSCPFGLAVISYQTLLPLPMIYALLPSTIYFS